MEKKQLTIGILALAIIAGIIVVPKLLNPMKDCGSDTDCFQEAVKNCERAKITYSRGEEEQGSFELYTESRGAKGTDCMFYFKVAKARFELEEEPESETERTLLATLQELFKELEGKAMTCKIPKEHVEANVMGSEELQKEYCTGPLVGAFEEATRRYNEAIREAYQ